MKQLYFLIALGIILATNATAQVGINTSGSQPDPSAILDVKSETKGVLIPRISFEQRNAIVNPAEGLMLFCTDCGINGAISIYSNGAWRTYSPCLSVAPSSGTHVALPTQITWNWNPAPGASGYKWNSMNNYNTSTDIGLATTKTESALTCNTLYSRYVWAYYSCGISTVSTLTQTTSVCPSLICGTLLPINHLAEAVAPVNKTVTYGTTTDIPGEPTKCWITRNLSAGHQATFVNDSSEESAGWYWQFNRKHAAGSLDYSGGSLYGRGSLANYWNSTQFDATNGRDLHFSGYLSNIVNNPKANAYSIRCLRDN